ncbi:hypothetical protein PIROE2DRAFT_14571 [Piromyces sp. E2]|nr:hypothetical protein PIROE2DRAFT_14571 [Piromyces sp. E2]|eukprot:OUM59804.1 hypothetical protein PIROE2DRAFT_14571 [Piromyces sp. E2]
MVNYYGYTQKDFIGNNTNPSFIDWMCSKGTSYDCYLSCMDQLNEIGYYNSRIQQVRVVVSAIQAPLNFLYFYWTFIVFMLHKFNFNKPVMKLLLGHFVLRCTGDIIDELGKLFPTYYSLQADVNGKDEYHCECGGNTLHPFKWIFTRCIGTFFWYTGEIIGDWYPLIRTKAVVKNKSIWIVYSTCALFNLTKIILIIFHFTMDPRKLYDLSTGKFKKAIIDEFYNNYWIIQLIIIYASIFYELSVYLVLKKNIFKVTKYDHGFFKKFKSLSEYRILVSAVVAFIFLPIASIALFLKIYFIRVKGKNLEFEFESLRLSIANLQYYMIFIDQILLITSNYESVLANFDIFNYFNSNSNSNNTSNINNQINFDDQYLSPRKSLDNSVNNNYQTGTQEIENSFIANTSMTAINSINSLKTTIDDTNMKI